MNDKPERKYNKHIITNARELRKNMTKEECHLWYDFLRKHSAHFSRQKVLGRYIVDFYCAEAKLVIEIDGAQHYTPEGREKDNERTAYLEKYGLTVVRITNEKINNNFQGVCKYINSLIEQKIANRP